VDEGRTRGCEVVGTTRQCTVRRVGKKAAALSLARLATGVGDEPLPRPGTTTQLPPALRDT
jgi:hypothetical protein